MRYLLARTYQFEHEHCYRIYVTTALNAFGAGMNISYVEMIKPRVEETRSEGEIIDNIKGKLRELGGE